MNKLALIAAGVASFAVAAPAHAATFVTYGAVNPGGVVTLTDAGPGALSSPINFRVDYVEGQGSDFTATFTFNNPFDPAIATGSASFTFDPDQLVFTGGSFGPGSEVFISSPTDPAGSAITVSLANLALGNQTLTLLGTLNPTGNGVGVVGGSLNLTQAAAVPEPATWAMFILGFGMLGAGLRRRHAQITAINARLTFA